MTSTEPGRLNSTSGSPMDACEHLLTCQWVNYIQNPVYMGIGSIYSVVAVFSRGVFTTGLFKALVKDSSYFWQAVFGLSDLADVCGFALYLILNGWLGEWQTYAKCYWCVWFIAKFSVSAYDFGVTNTLLMSLIMAADRLMSLTIPVKYAIYYSKNKLKIVIAICCVCTSLTLDGFDYILFTPIPKPNGSWKMVSNVDFLSTTTATVWIAVQNLVLVVGLVLLAVLNGFMLQKYKKRITSLNSITVDRQKVAGRKRDERILTTLTAWQCLFVGVNVLIAISYYSVANYVFSPCSCYYHFVAAVTDAICMLVRLFDIYICLAINKSFRNLFKSGLSSCCCCKFLHQLDSTTGSS